MAPNNLIVNSGANVHFSLLLRMIDVEIIKAQTKKWIVDVVIGCNFCPFAAREIKKGSVHFEVNQEKDIEKCLYAFVSECVRLDENPEIETSLLIFPLSFQKFYAYLDLVDYAEKILKKQGYEGIYQVASFHPLYCFAGNKEDDPSNYTNRSPYPILHLLREDSVEKALDRYPHPEKIPENNMAFTREKGLLYMKKLRDSCLGNMDKL